MKIICISGKAGHGKDTAAQFLRDQFELGENRVLITHYADLVKYVCRMFFNWDGLKNESGRELMQTVGTDIVRDEDPNYWVRFIADMMKFFGSAWDYVLISDTRFINEIEYLKEVGFDVTHMRVVRDEYMSDMPEEQQNHISETELDSYLADIYVHNSGSLSEFYDNLLIAVDELGL